MIHHLKIWPQYYSRVLEGTKTFEVRKNDRGYQAGDTVVLQEWDPKPYERMREQKTSDETPVGYTGNEITFKIGYVLAIDAERVVFSLKDLDPTPVSTHA